MKKDPVVIVGLLVLVGVILFILVRASEDKDIPSIVFGFIGAMLVLLIKYFFDKPKKS